MLNKIPLKIHCWGGLGSQLYAWALFEDLIKNMPSKKFVLVFHTSGVTERVNNLGFLRQKIDIREVRNFKENVNLVNATSSVQFNSLANIKSIILQLIKVISLKLRFLESANSELEKRRIRFWTLQLRGHYSNTGIKAETLLLMEKRARECGQSWLVSEISKVGNYVDSLTGSHIRLGDLITLESKTPLDIPRVTNQLFSYVGDDVCEILLASDTLEIAKSIISNILPKCKIEEIDCDPWSTIKN